MADIDFADIFGEGSDDEAFDGFDPVELNDAEFDEVNDIDLDDDDLREIEQTIEREERDLFHEAYDCEWLQNFDSQTGPIQIDDTDTPYDIFQRFFDAEVLNLLVDQTNLYYRQFIESKGGIDAMPTHSRTRKWTDVTEPEMKVFLAVLLYMGLVRMPSYEMYWSTNDLINLKELSSYMTRDRFLNILSFLHATDNSNEPARDSPDYDPSYKISRISKLLVERWQAAFNPRREISVDETLVPFKGRTKLLQYIPSKPHKWGLKVWTLADSKNGYVYNWDLFTGKMPEDARGRGVAHRVVVKLCEPLFGKGHHLYCDNFFTSPSLFTELAENQTGACGTLRSNRQGVPAEVKRAKPDKGEPPFVHRNGSNLFICWMDKRLVHLSTTVHTGNTYTKNVRSRFHPNFAREVDFPKAVQLYTKYMGGVDLADQQTSYCALLHRMLKWWKKLFVCNLLEVSVANAKVIYKSLHPDKRVKTEKFRLDVIQGLLSGYERSTRVFRRPMNNPPARLVERHFIRLNLKRTAAGRRSTPDCEVCSDRTQKRHQTQYICGSCNVPLCVFPCFERYHTLADFKIVCTRDLHE